MNELIVKIQGPIKNLLAQMYTGKEYFKTLMVTDERKYHQTVNDLKELTDLKYVSLSRKGKKLELRILKKGQDEIQN